DAAGALLTVGRHRDPFRNHDALTVPDLAVALEAQPRHESLGGADVRDELAQTVDRAEAIAEPDGGFGDRPQQRLAPALVRHRPGAEPRIDGVNRLGICFVGDDIRSEERRVGKECRCRWWLYD